MDSCCYADEYGELFSHKDAKRAVRRLRRKGLEGTARELAEEVEALGIEGASVIEVGGGVGGLHTRLLQRGASRAVNVDLSPEWEVAARGLLVDVGLADRVERLVGDFVAAAEELEGADVVVLNRVVCCYPNWESLLGGAAGKAERVLALSFPVDRWWTHAALSIENGLRRLRRRSFRAYVHPATAMLGFLGQAGFVVTYDHSGWTWRAVILERAVPQPA